MKQRRYALFAFLASDYQAAQAWLEEQDRRGWELQSLSYWLPTARLVPKTREDIRYCVDLTRGYRDPSFAPDGFDQLVRDSGWTLVGTTRSGLDVYQSQPGRDPVPIQTDPELVRRRFFGREVVPSLASALLVAVLLALTACLFLDPRFFLRLLPSTWELLRAVSLVAVSGFLLYWAVHNLVFWVRGRGGPPPVSRKGARFRGLLWSLTILYWCVALLLPLADLGLVVFPPQVPPEELASQPLVLAEDLGLGPAETEGARRRSSPFLTELELEQRTEAGWLDQTRWDCRSSWAADRMIQGTLAAYDGWGIQPAGLGFEESWSGDHFLLLRQGNTVVLLQGSADWTDPDIRAILWAQLELS